MVDLIPIGTVNRTAAENNAVKSSDNVKEAAESDRIAADHKQKLDEPRRRFKRRQGDRRASGRGARWTKPERRKNRDRRASAVADDNNEANENNSNKNASRKGRFIDVQA